MAYGFGDWLGEVAAGGVKGVIYTMDFLFNGGKDNEVREKWARDKAAADGATTPEQKAVAQKAAQDAYDTSTIIGEMERQLELRKKEAQDFKADADQTASIIERESDRAEGRVETKYGAQQQSNYLEIVAAENNFQQMKVNTSKSIGAMNAAKGASGLRNSGSITDFTRTETASAEASTQAARKQLDYGKESIISGAWLGRREGLDTVSNSRQAATIEREKGNRAVAQFDTGSAYMNLYEWNKSRVKGASDMRTTYADSVIKDMQKADRESILGRLFNTAAGGFKGYSTGGPVGAIFGAVGGYFA